MAVKTEKIQYNQLPRPTFRWMKVNHLELDPLKAQALPLTRRKNVTMAKQLSLSMKATRL